MSRYNESITEPMLHGAIEEFSLLADRGRVDIIPAPGAYELPALANAAARTGRYDGVLALGCIIKGETSHDVYIAQAVAEGLVNVTLLTGVPVALGVLTTNNAAQAKARAGGKKGNKGAEAMSALLDTIRSIEALNRGKTVGASMGRRPDKARRRA